MQNKIFTIPLFGNEEAVEELNKFLRGNKVANISKSLVSKVIYQKAFQQPEISP